MVLKRIKYSFRWMLRHEVLHQVIIHFTITKPQMQPNPTIPQQQRCHYCRLRQDFSLLLWGTKLTTLHGTFVSSQHHLCYIIWCIFCIHPATWRDELLMQRDEHCWVCPEGKLIKEKENHKSKNLVWGWTHFHHFGKIVAVCYKEVKSVIWKLACVGFPANQAIWNQRQGRKFCYFDTMLRFLWSADKRQNYDYSKYFSSL